MRRLSLQTVRKFQRQIYRSYHRAPRSFPWRDTHDPYRILVSEVMLQQTQADRVVTFFKRFVSKFRSVSALAHAKTGGVVRVWQGLGYNRRALNLQRAARLIVEKHNGVIPQDVAQLDALPGIGKYTAGAIRVFAFNQPSVFVETNIRTVYLHYFLKRKKQVSDTTIFDLVDQTLDEKNPREWYQALMDYGAMLKRTVGNSNVRSKQYVRQSPFKGSRRELRGKLLALASEKTVTPSDISAFSKQSGFPVSDIRTVLQSLVSEGFLRNTGQSFRLR